MSVDFAKFRHFIRIGVYKQEFYEFRVRDTFRVRDAGKKTLCLKTHFLVQMFLECDRTPLGSLDFSENAPTLYKIFLDLQLTGLAGALPRGLATSTRFFCTSKSANL